jgi:hypothetical protein
MLALHGYTGRDELRKLQTRVQDGVEMEKKRPLRINLSREWSPALRRPRLTILLCNTTHCLGSPVRDNVKKIEDRGID